MTKHLVSPAIVQAGDHVLANNHDLMVKYIQGPDHIGVYDFHGVNELVDVNVFNGNVADLKNVCIK